MTWQYLLIDGPAALLDAGVAAFLWLDRVVTRAVALVYHAYWIIVATTLVLLLLLVALSPWLPRPDPPAIVVPRGPRV